MIGPPRGVLGVEERIERLSTGQHGLVTRRQLVELGLSSDAIKHRIARGRLRRLHRGVYSVGHLPLTPIVNARAATLACGPRSLVSHRSAAELWDLTATVGGGVDVTVVGSHSRTRAGITVHRATTMSRRDVTTRHGVPVTSPARTLVDLAATATATELGRALNEARVLRLIGAAALHATIDRAGRARGAATLRALIDREDGHGFTRSEIEHRMRGLVRKARLPAPETNAELHGHEVDFLWRRQRLVVETDGWQSHSTPGSFESDRRRDAILQNLGYRVLRFTWRQVAVEPEATLATLAIALAALR